MGAHTGHASWGVTPWLRLNAKEEFWEGGQIEKEKRTKLERLSGEGSTLAES